MVLHRSEEERDGLALDIISHAVEDFHEHAILKRRWSPTGGAALRTWFIGTCALNFPRAYRQWSRNRAERLDRITNRHDINLDRVGGEIARRAADPAASVIVRTDLRELIDQAQPMTKVILGLLLQGLTQAEIATELGLTVRAIEGRLYRFRTRIAGGWAEPTAQTATAESSEFGNPWAETSLATATEQSGFESLW
jgi:DNA-directed RNA polymerase specialized sigma24 family protein